MNKKVLITGATGQDGSFMAEYLLENTDNTLILAARRTSQSILSNINHILNSPRVKLITLDLMDGQAICQTIKDERPDYFINLGAQTFVADAWKHPLQHMQINAFSLIHILEAVREYVPTCRVYSAGSSEQFGNGNHSYSPRSMYGVSKCTASLIAKVYRESYGLYVVHGILYNHESERRQDYFVTRKITKGVARIKKALDSRQSFEPIELGNLDAKRDWSHASDFVAGIWLMLNQDRFHSITNNPESVWRYSKETDEESRLYIVSKIKDYVLASGETHSIREFVELAFEEAGIYGHWITKVQKNKLSEEYCMYEPNYKICSPSSVKYTNTLIKINPKFYRPADVEHLCGDATAARQELGWQPKISFNQLIKEMVQNDIGNKSKID